jgi:hyperosmotically inducible periplasmic protein
MMHTVRVLSFVLLLLAPVFAAEPVHDDVIFDTVRIRIANDREVGGGRIEVKVEKGVVELTGKVKTERQKERAEKITRKVKGVKDVVNRIQVAPV